MPAPSVRARIVGVVSIRDLVSKHRQRIRVLASAVLLVVGFNALAVVPRGQRLESHIKAWACHEPPPNPSNLGSLLTTLKSLKKEFSSCATAAYTGDRVIKLTVDRVAKFNVEQKLRLVNRLPPEATDVLR
jgi:hypothetical protein